MRIVLVEPNLSDDGAMRVSLDRAARWQRAGASVELFVAEPGPADPVVVPDGLAVRQGASAPGRFREILTVGAPKLHRLVRKADVVVAGREIDTGLLLAAVVARTARRPLAVTVQSRPDIALELYVSDRMKSVTRRALLSAQMAVCVSAGLVPTLTELGLPASRTRVVTNGVDVPAIRRQAALLPALALPDAPLVVATGRLHRQKGFDVLLRAHATALAAGCPRHAVVVLGQGPDRKQLEQLAASLGVGETVVFAGFVPNPLSVVARAALFVLPSRWEGYPLALAEALSVATPSVATDCIAGPRELLDADRFGRLVPVEDVEALSTAITDHLLDPTDLRARAAAAAAEAEVRFDPDVAARDHLELLASLVRP